MGQEFDAPIDYPKSYRYIKTVMDSIKFYLVADTYGCFSNFAQYPIHIDGELWPTSEHYFQGQKFEDADQREAIRRARSAMAASKMGRDRTKKLRADWEQVKDEIMLAAVRAKFNQHLKLASTLLGTRDAQIIEHTATDSYWGDGGNGHGKNKLGQILMQVREELRRGR